MTADLTAEQAARWAEFEAAAPAPESLRERVARAIAGAHDDPVSDRDWRAAYDEEERESYRREADAALAVLRGPATEADKAVERVLALADEWDADHADWCCKRGCAWPSGRHLTDESQRRVVEGVAKGEFTPPGSLPTEPCSGECTCEVGRYLHGIRDAIRGDQ